MKYTNILLFFLFCNFSQNIRTAEADSRLRVASFNIDTNIGKTEEGPARESNPEWRVQKRIPLIIKALSALKKPDVVFLQEGRDFITNQGDRVDSVSPLQNWLKEQGYLVVSQPYNDTDKAFCYITALLASKFRIDSQEKTYLTQTPDRPTDHTDHANRLSTIKDQNFGEEWERCVSTVNATGPHNKKYRFTNVHLGIGEKGRLEGCNIIRTLAEEAIARNPKLSVVIAGDFNSFPDWKGPEQLQIMKGSGILQEATENLALSKTNKPVATSFIAFPHDFSTMEKALNDESLKQYNMPLSKYLFTLAPQERRAKIQELFKRCNALGGHLDRMFTYGFSNTNTKLVLTPTFEDFDENQFSEEYVKEYIMKHYQEGPAFASDHQIIVTDLE